MGMRATVTGTAAIMLALAVSACGRKEGDPPYRRVVDRPVRLQVENHQYLDVTVYAVAGGFSVRVGDVTGTSTGSFTLNPRRISLVNGLQLMVDPIGSSETYLSPMVYPSGGATVELTIGADLSQSFVEVR